MFNKRFRSSNVQYLTFFKELYCGWSFGCSLQLSASLPNDIWLLGGQETPLATLYTPDGLPALPFYPHTVLSTAAVLSTLYSIWFPSFRFLFSNCTLYSACTAQNVDLATVLYTLYSTWFCCLFVQFQVLPQMTKIFWLFIGNRVSTLGSWSHCTLHMVCQLQNFYILP